jgi:hypothetical protein
MGRMIRNNIAFQTTSGYLLYEKGQVEVGKCRTPRNKAENYSTEDSENSINSKIYVNV